jgi:riboflavin transporter FmnP
VPRDRRSPVAEAWERTIANVVGYGLAFVALVAVARYKLETARRRVIAASLLVGVAFVCSPIVHNYYYVLLLPLVAAFVDAALDIDHRVTSRRSILALAVFALVDVIARLPAVGLLLRDLGLPLLTLVGSLAAAAWLLTRDSADSAQTA